jgi:hypothetical protein
MNCQFIRKFEYMYVVRGTWWSLSEDPESNSSLGPCYVYSRCHVKTLGSWGSEFDAWSVLYADISADRFKALSVTELILCMCEAYWLSLQFRAHDKRYIPSCSPSFCHKGWPHIRNGFCVLAYLCRGPEGQHTMSGDARRTTANTVIYFIT